MNCKHHPGYDLAAGEPVDEWQFQDMRTGNQLIPCPCCWQARAKWSQDKYTETLRLLGTSVQLQEQVEERDDKSQERIAELEKQLADERQSGEMYAQEYEGSDGVIKDLQEREAVLREALEDISTLALPGDCRKRARAALEVK